MNEQKPEASFVDAEQILPPDLLTVSPSPHIKHKDTTQSVMRDVMIALTPALLWAC